METYWVPGVNHLGTHGRWAFAEFTEVYQIEADFEAKVEARVRPGWSPPHSSRPSSESGRDDRERAGSRWPTSWIMARSRKGAGGRLSLW